MGQFSVRQQSLAFASAKKKLMQPPVLNRRMPKASITASGLTSFMLYKLAKGISKVKFSFTTLICPHSHRRGGSPPLQGGECNVPLAKGDGREAAGGRSHTPVREFQFAHSSRHSRNSRLKPSQPKAIIPGNLRDFYE